MPFFGRSIESLTEADLQRLIDDAVVEAKDVEYKVACTIATGDDKKELLADLTSFANTTGGHLFVGIMAVGNRPVSLPGLPLSSVEQDRTKLQIESLARDSVDPRLPTLQMHFVPLQSGRYVLAIRIVQSWAAPHMVKTSAKFFARNSSGKFPLDTQQLRTAFAASEDLGKRMGAWRTERIGRLLANDAPWNMTEGAKLVIHLIPHQSFGQPRVEFLPTPFMNLPMVNQSPMPSKPNFDGCISRGTDGRSVTQLFRNGCLEGTDGYTLGFQVDSEEENAVRSKELEEAVIEFVDAGIATLHRLGLQPPVFACVTLTGVRGRHLTWGDEGRQGSKLPQDLLPLPEVAIEDLRSPCAESRMKATFDVLWQAFGNARSKNYDAKGNRI